MTHQQHYSKIFNIILWTAQVVISVSMLWASYKKLFQPIVLLSQEWPWTADVSPLFVKFTGVIDFLGALGIVLPTLLKTLPKLTVITALAIVSLMIAAGIFHISRGEASLIGINIFFLVTAAFVAWGRSKYKPLSMN